MTRRVYIAGPMSRESFCRCDRPSARSTLPIAADLIGAGVRDAVLDEDYHCPTIRALDEENAQSRAPQHPNRQP